MAQANLKHDLQGFLQGEPVQLQALERLWGGIRDDVRAIRRAVVSEAGSQRAGSQRQQVQASAVARGQASKPEARPLAREFRELAGTLQKSHSKAANDSAQSLLSRARKAQEVMAEKPKSAMQGLGSAQGGKVVSNVRRRDAGGRFVAVESLQPVIETRALSNKVQVARPLDASKQQGKAKPDSENKATAARERAQNGQFIKGDGGDETGGALGAGAGRLADAIKGIGDAEELDPSIKAFQEVARPMARLYEVAGGGASKQERKQDRWYRRFWAHMRQTADVEEVHNKAMRKSLKALEEKPTETGRKGGMMGGVMALLTGMRLLMASVAGLLSLLKALIPALGRGGGAGAGLPGVGDKGGKSGKAGGLKALAKRLPLIGGLLSAVGMASSLVDSESSDMNRAEKNKAAGNAIGGFGGTLAGGAAGFKVGALAGAIGGPVGVAIGGVLGAGVGMFFGDKAGQIMGEKVGEFVNYLRDADIPGKFSAAADYLKESFNAAASKLEGWWQSAKSMGAAALDKAQKGVEAVTEKVNATNDAFQKLTGVDVKASIRKAAEVGAGLARKATEGIGVAYSATKETAAQAGQSLVNAAQNSTIGKGVKVVSNAIKSTEKQRWESGARDDLVSAANGAGIDPGIMAKIARFESGFNSNAAPIAKNQSRNTVRQHDGRMAISSAHGYGQFLDGTWTEMVNKHGAKYGVAGAGKLTKSQANTLRGDTKLQAQMLAEFTKANIAKGRARGGTDDDANVYAYHNLGDGDANKVLGALKSNPNMTARQALLAGATKPSEISRVEQVISGNASLYGDGNISVKEAYSRMGNFMRAGDYYAQDARQYAAKSDAAKADAAKVHALNSAPTMMQAQAVAPAPTVTGNPSASAKPVEVAPAPAVPTQVVSAGAGRASGNAPLAEPGQDMTDRRLVHVATGGIGGPG